MGLFDKYNQIIERHSKLDDFDVDPFNVCVDRVISPTVGISIGSPVVTALPITPSPISKR